MDQHATPQVKPFQGEFDEYKAEILAEIHANEERALVEAELRAKAREAKKIALEEARKAGHGAKKVSRARIDSVASAWLPHFFG